MLTRHQIFSPTLIHFHSSLSPNHRPNYTKQSQFLDGFRTSLSPRPNTPISDSGLRFGQKLLHIENLKVNSSKALHRNPNLRSAQLDTVQSVEKCLSSMGIECTALGRILDMHPQLLTSDPYDDLYPVFDFLLNEVHIRFPDICKSIIRCPRLLLCSVDHQLRPTLYFLKTLGFVGRHAITYQNTLLLVYTVEGTLVPKLEYLQNLGFSYKEVVKMVVRSPGLLTYSIEKNFRPKMEYFLDEMKGDLAELKRFPQYFSFSLEGKVKPRHRVLVEHGFSLPLPEMLKVSDGEFNSRLIEMQLEQIDDERHFGVWGNQDGKRRRYDLRSQVERVVSIEKKLKIYGTRRKNIDELKI